MFDDLSFVVEPKDIDPRVVVISWPVLEAVKDDILNRLFIYGLLSDLYKLADRAKSATALPRAPPR
jgi:hypothetical protein